MQAGSSVTDSQKLHIWALLSLQYREQMQELMPYLLEIKIFSSRKVDHSKKDVILRLMPTHSLHERRMLARSLFDCKNEKICCNL
jgi:hypothetical protein